MRGPTAARSRALLQTSGTALPHRSRLAFLLALLAALCWGLLPLALHMVVPVLDTCTITWCRFLVAGVAIGLYLARRGALPRPWRLPPSLLALFPVAVVGITLNYTLFVVGLHLSSPETSQVVGQSASLFLLLGGLVVFRERFSRIQWLGAVLLIGGLALFFNRRLPSLFTGGSSLGLGVLLLLAGSFSWAIYSLAQKRLLREWTSPQLLCLLFTGGALLLTPLAHPERLRLLSGAQAWALAFCCLNTLVAYGAYAEAMHLGEVARVSATVAVSPLFTSAATLLAAGWLIPDLVPEIPNVLTLLGVAAVVGGSALCALGAARPPAPDPAPMP
ncbi:MAG: DMT family transporter, partial [Gammaproteobacteria bacterium]|nr:DMT family transporter [Gammaproteobacteria bacterium]